MSSRPQDKYIALVMLVIFLSASTLCDYTEPTSHRKAVLYRSEYKQSPDTKIRTTANVKRYKYIGTYTVTHYCTCKICCGLHAKGITASGKKAKVGMIAASRGMSFGTRLKIDGKVYSVEDGLAMRYDNRIDILVKDHKTAIKLGIKQVKIYQEVLK